MVSIKIKESLMHTNRILFVALLVLIALLAGCEKPVGDKPRIINAAFLNDVFTVEYDLNVKVTIMSPLPATMTYTWYINDNEVYDVNETTLAAKHFRKRDRVSCEISVVDSLGTEAEPVTLGPVTIENAFPRITWADIMPTDSIYKGIDLAIEVETEDPDGDDVEIRYTWFVGKSLVSTDSIINGDLLVAGENVVVELVPYDGDTTGRMYEVKRPIIVQNTPPNILGTPFAVIHDSLLTCKINAQDPDGDPLTFAIESGPSGMTIDGTGLIKWIFPLPQNDTTYIIAVSVTDDKGAFDFTDLTPDQMTANAAKLAELSGIGVFDQAEPGKGNEGHFAGDKVFDFDNITNGEDIRLACAHLFVDTDAAVLAEFKSG